MKFKSAEADWNTSFVSQQMEGRNPKGCGGAEVVSTEWMYRTGNSCRKPVRERTSMKTYLKFAASFWMSAFLVTASMATAQTAPTQRRRRRAGAQLQTLRQCRSGSLRSGVRDQAVGDQAVGETMARTPCAKAAGLNSVRRISSGQSVMMQRASCRRRRRAALAGRF